ncbi:MAG: alpha/beta hydrolase [Gammaproteobacteria bacterium]
MCSHARVRPQQRARRPSIHATHIRLFRSLRRLALLLLATLGCACSTPGERFLDDAAARGFSRELRDADGLPIVVLRNHAGSDGAALHVYLDGDGQPFATRHRVATDPSSRERLALALMAADPHPAVLVGRPCYYVSAADCDSSLWTTARYGERVVTAMTLAIERVAATRPGVPLRLIGYSGGGTLAMLLAPRLPRVDTVVTIAANLDVAAWTRHHAYTPLGESQDPAVMPPLPAHIRQHHFLGARDDNVPPALVRAAIARQPQARVDVVADYGHACCWAAAWPKLLTSALQRSD